jgi:ATP-dependent Clp protease ATP-binding subunit ClpB
METNVIRPFTSRTRVAMAIARGIAAARGDADLTVTHVAAGIFREGANPALAGLWYAGLSEVAIKSLGSEFEYSLGAERGHPTPRSVTIDFTSGEEEVTRVAEAEVEERGDSYLGTEHFLLGILRSDNPVSKRLAEVGISRERFEVGLAAALRGDPPPDQAGTSKMKGR